MIASVIVAEPPVSRFDIHFRLWGIPVRVHPFFWLVTAILGLIQPGARSTGQVLTFALIWVTAVFVSILVHELGHALVARSYGWPPRVTLYNMGGVASYSPTRPTIASRIWIAFSGPGAGFLLGILLIAGIFFSGHSAHLPGIPWSIGSGPGIPGNFGYFLDCLLFVNIFWGMVNLVPIQPLDGGTIMHAALDKYRPRASLQSSFKVSIGASVACLALVLFIYHSTFLAIMFGLLGFQNWQMLQQARQHGW